MMTWSYRGSVEAQGGADSPTVVGGFQQAEKTAAQASSLSDLGG